MSRDASRKFPAARSRGGLITAGGVAAVIGLASLGGGVAVAADGGGLAPPAISPASVFTPTAVPDRVILTPTETPATSQSVSWRTSTAVTSPQAQFAVAGPSPVESGAAATIAAVSTEFVTDLGYSLKHHTATLAGLSPDTSYVYRVGDGETWSEWLEFTTATEGASSFSFLLQGDAQNDNKAYTSRSFRAAFEARPYADLVVHAGDLIDTESSDAEWGEWHEAAAFANQYLNVVAATGNHEYYPGPELSRHWNAQFSYPDNGPESAPGLAGTVYSVDYKGVRFIALNSTQAFNAESRAAQTEWLEGLLADNPNEWTVVAFHHPIFSVTSGRDNAALREAWMPLFEQYDVDLVVQGHDHAYGRGNLLTNEENLPEGTDAASAHTGPVYLVSVAGPKMYIPDPEDDNNWTRNDANLRVVGRDVQLFQTVDVVDGRMHVEARTVDGAVFDSFTIAKDDDGEKLVYDDASWVGGAGSTRDGVAAPPAPGAGEPGGGEPGNGGDPGDGDPGDGDPGDGEPGNGEPGNGEPGGGEPDDGEPGGGEPDGDDPSTPIGTVELDTLELTPGGAVTVNASGFEPGEEVRIELHSDPVLLATVTADAAGAVSQRVTVPRTVAPGEHTLVLIGQSSGVRAEIGVIVTRLSAAQLPVTGGGAAWLLGAGVLLSGVGAGALALGLRRKREAGIR